MADPPTGRHVAATAIRIILMLTVCMARDLARLNCFVPSGSDSLSGSHSGAFAKHKQRMHVRLE